MSDSYIRWENAVAQMKSQSIELDKSLKIQIQELETILSDLDEHGEDNLEEYGGGKYSYSDFKNFLKEAKKGLKNFNRKTPRIEPKQIPKSKSEINFALSTKSAGGGVWPVRVGEYYFSHENKNVCLRHNSEENRIIHLLANGLPIPVGEIRSVAASKDGKYVAVGHWQHKIYCFDGHSGEMLFENSEQVDWVTGLAFSPDSTFLVSGGVDKMMMYELPGGKVKAAAGPEFLLNGSGSIGAITELAVATDGLSILFPVNDKIVIVDGVELKQKETIEIWSNEFQFFHDRLVALTGNAISIVDANNQEVIEESVLLQRKTRWAAGESLALHEGHGLAALILREEAEANVSTYELQIWSLSPLHCLKTVPLIDFVMNDETSFGGIAFMDNKIIIVGKTENLSLEYK